MKLRIKNTRSTEAHVHPLHIQWRNEGGKGGHLPPGAALWGRQIEVGMLRTNYEISNVSGY